MLVAAMIPAEPRLDPAPRRFYVDALNLAYWCGRPPSLRLPLTLMSGLLERRDEALLVFDASAPYRFAQEQAVYAQLKRHPAHFIEVPSGWPADRVMLRHATSRRACVISRDHYRDHRRRYRRLIDDPARLLSGSVQDGQLRIPALALALPLPDSADAAWARLQVLLSDPAAARGLRP